ncbi:insulin receptor substrate 1-B isoform 1-T1 [Salvelinus alpinus]
MASPTTEQQGCFSDVRKVGYLRKPKSMHKRFFVLRAASAAGPSRLEYYENEKKWRHKSGVPKRSILLESCFNINKRADSKNKYLVALYTKDEYFSIAADSEQEQDRWHQALVDLHNKGKVHDDAAVGGSGMAEENYGEETMPGPAFKEVWQVILKPKGLGHTKNFIGIYRLCLTNKTISFVKLNSDAAAVVLQLMNIRRCGHSENFFFIEVGRSAVTGPGEFWMQVDDSVVAQNMHETILEAMKAMSEEFRPRSKSHSSSNCSNPISVPLRRHHHSNLPPSQVGLGRRSRTESVTATSPAGPGKHSHSFRVRASSDGEGTMSRPASVDGSPCEARTQSHRHRGASRLHPPLNHSRSIPMPSSRCSPSAISPVSLSSSSTSGHGSTSDCLYPCRSSASISGSPIDGGFISSDEYGSSPCDFRSSFRSVTPDSLSHTPPAREEELNNYICMAKPATLLRGHCGCSPHPHGTPSHLDEPELEKCFRKRTHSSSTSPLTVCHQKTPSQSSTVSLEEYTVMQPAYSSCSRASSYRHSAFMPTHSYPEEGIDIPLEGNRVSKKDDGYMPMTPGVAPATGKSADYMPMSPKSVSVPQQINSHQHPKMDSNGYMMMSPSGSCSPDTTNYGQIWTNGVNPKLSVESTEEKLLSPGDYMNMSPASCSMTSTPPDCYINLVEDPPKSMYSYFSLPRSFEHSHRKLDQNPLHLSLSSGRLAFGDSLASSTSSDSLMGQGYSSQPVVKPKRADVDSRLARPTRLSLEGNKASTHECPFPADPKSPGEYVNIKFNDKPFSAGLATHFSPVFPGSGPEGPAEISSDYMNMHLGAQGRGIPSWAAKPLASCTDGYAIVAPVAPSVIPCENLCRRDYSSTQTDYSDTHMILNAPMSTIDVTPFSVSPPSQDLSVLGAGPSAVPLGLMGPLSGLSAFTRVNSSLIWNQGAKLIRANQQGRRRHSSETFSSTGVPVNAASPSVEGVKRHSSASFENVWLKPGESPLSANGRRESPSEPSSNGQNQNRLNYIDLDLAQDQNLPEWSSLWARARDTQGGSDPEDLRAYASISFQKADESRMNPAQREGNHAQNEQYGWWHCHSAGSCQDEPAGRVPHEGGGGLPCNAQR